MTRREAELVRLREHAARTHALIQALESSIVSSYDRIPLSELAAAVLGAAGTLVAHAARHDAFLIIEDAKGSR